MRAERSSWFAGDGRAVVPLLGTGRDARAFDPDHDSPPGAVALGVARRVADRVLARQLLGDLCVNRRQLRDGVREERAAAGFLGELAQDEFRFAETARRAGALVGPQADRVDRRFGALGEI